ncbi:MAG TPA: elongation factor P hydroxylase [Cellvibrionaceae bacterium]
MATDLFEISPQADKSLITTPADSQYLHSALPSEINSADLIRLFDELFVPSLHTRLCGGNQEPIYLPACDKRLNEICFTQDYSSSALHEIAHWCVAGPERLKKVDFGYWYAPDGRSSEQQCEFERVEVKPQALEWIFSIACGARFSVSADNLAQGLGASSAFKCAVTAQAQIYCEEGLPERASVWTRTLADYYRVSNPLNPDHYRLEYLGE